MSKMTVNETREYMERARSLFKEEIKPVPQKDKKALPPLPEVLPVLQSENEGNGYGYIAIFKGKQIEITDATSLYDAKKKAIQRLNVPAAKQGLLVVMPAEKDGEPIIHTPSMEEGAMGRQQDRQNREQQEIALLKNALRKKAFFRNFLKQAEEFITSNPVPGGEDASEAVAIGKIITGAIEDQLSGNVSLYEYSENEQLNDLCSYCGDPVGHVPFETVGKEKLCSQVCSDKWHEEADKGADFEDRDERKVPGKGPNRYGAFNFRRI